jgi:Zn-dependent peptidase ImmA (M78 family)
MMAWLDNQSQDAISFFWKRAGELEQFPRSLERSLALALPVALIKLPRLSLFGIEHWLENRGIQDFTFGCESRSVRGCLIAYSGNGIIFVDGSDPPDELRFSIAHEVGHFLVDYLIPRQQLISQLGVSVVGALDGIRPPRVSERVQALLIGKTLGIHIDLLDRKGNKDNAAFETWQVEDRADKVALALLAPPDQVINQIDLSIPTFQKRSQQAIVCLLDVFGLPSSVAEYYANNLLKAIGKGPSWAESLRSHE